MRWISPLLLLVPVAPLSAADAGAEFFENKIRPVLVEHCYGCHSADAQKAGKLKAGLRLDTKAGTLAGGDSGPSIVAKKPKDSLLIQAMEYGGDMTGMPPKGKLPAAVVADFRKWVEMGAPDPRDEKAVVTGQPRAWADVFRERQKWWSLQPVKASAIPDGSANANPIDRFLSARLKAAGLTPPSLADKPTQLRRLTYAFTGLPPSPEEIAAFLADTAPDAYEKTARKLLDSPRFGERMAQHWMDVIRYAESHGSEGDPRIPEAWRFRDYLIRAFNADVPYDQLVREQIAGDLLKNPRRDPTLGLNESAIGPAHLRMVELGFQPVDSLDELAKTTDNQIDVVSKAFLGLTVACARCHDHKFDAISQRDYTALYGIFASSRPAQITVSAPTPMQQRDLLKARIKSEFVNAWRKAATSVPDRLLNPPKSPAPLVFNLITATERNQAEARIAALEKPAREAIAKARGQKPSTNVAPRPFAMWHFDGDTRDSVGTLNAELQGGATIRNGRLILDGKSGFARTGSLPKELRAKTLETWVSLPTLEQRGGGVMTVEKDNGGIFDAIVFAERQPNQWMAGSNNFRRTRDVDGSAETAKPGELVHIAAVYAADGSIRLFRNGRSYGESYTPSGAELERYSASTSRVLFGLRHTGGGRGLFTGEIDEARLYDRALTAAEVKASFQSGPSSVTEDEILDHLHFTTRLMRAKLLTELAAITARIDVMNAVNSSETGDPLEVALRTAAKDPTHPLRPWVDLQANPDPLAPTWKSLSAKWQTEATSRKSDQRPGWNLRDPVEFAKWFRHGVGIPGSPSRPGEFAIPPSGPFALTGIYPAGGFSHLVSAKGGGILTSPRFPLPKDGIWVRFLGANGGGVRVIVDNYPLGSNGTYPQSRPNRDTMEWQRFDTSYRAGSDAYLEFATPEDLTRPQGAEKSANSPRISAPYFGVAEVRIGGPAPVNDVFPLLPLFDGPAVNSREELAKRIGSTLKRILDSWRDNTLTDDDAAFLDAFVRSGILPSTVSTTPEIAKLVAEYRRLESEVPAPVRVPGVLETIGYNSPLFVRGNHRTPSTVVPRGFLEALGGKPYSTTGTGRLELANDLTNPANPLVSRVIVNRLWHWLFGRGIVPTTDNFGKLGEAPTHPELLDWLAANFVQDGWSVKRAMFQMVTSQAFRASSTPSAEALKLDAGNRLWSRFPVLRLDAESVRDGLLAATGELNPQMFGPPVRTGPLDDGRRSVYLAVIRNSPQPFLEVFDKPPPLSARGNRDVTTLPAQSLARMNSPFITELANRWGKKLATEPGSPNARIQRMFLTAIGRSPTETELRKAREYWANSATDNGMTLEQAATDPRPWQDLAHAICCLTETIYLR